ncbi:MAG TPA: GIY-YIG nuclease family protein [Candidatus Goldiibacteriota bacterium]|nr:GIY-YIG nuclease family protein [Candidatus Goldiibacteriota bacterium]
MKANRRRKKGVYRSKNWSVYVLRCADTTLYTGISNNVMRRLKKHNNGSGAKYITEKRRPVSLVYEESGFNYGQALKRERKIKSMAKAGKEALVRRQAERS